MANTATQGAAAVNAAGLSPNGSTNAPAQAGVGRDGVGVHFNGTPMTTDIARAIEPDLIVDPVDRVLTKQAYSAFPLDQMLRSIGAETEKGMRYEHYSIDIKPVMTTVKTSAVSAGYGNQDMYVENDSIFGPRDIILVKAVKAVTGGTTTMQRTPLRIEVVEKASNGKLVVRALNGTEGTGANAGKTLMPTIPVGTEVYRLAAAYAESDMKGNLYGFGPTKAENYMQIFKTGVAMTSIMQESETEVKLQLSDLEEAALSQLRLDIEATFWFGCKSFHTVNGKNYYTCGGVIEQMIEGGSHLIPYTPSQLTGTTGYDYLYKNIINEVFTGNCGSRKRYLFCGTGAMTNIALLPGIQKQIQAKDVFVRFGVEWKTISFMGSELELIVHPLFDMYGMTNCMAIIDAPYIKKKVFRSLTKSILDLRKSGEFDGDSNVWTEISSPCLKYPEVHALVFVPSEFNPGSYESSSSSSSSSTAAA